MLAYNLRVCRDNAKRFVNLLLKTVMTETTIMSVVCFIQAAGYDAADLFWPARLRTLVDDSRACEYKWVLAPHSGEMKTSILIRSLLRINSDCAIDAVVTIIAFARAGKIYLTVPDCLSWILYKLADATIIFVT